MDTVRISLQGAWELLYTGLILGAGLPILFALGVRLASGGSPTTVEGAAEGMAAGSDGFSRYLAWIARIFAALCFLLVLFGVITGIMIIVAAGMGKEVSFENIYPTFVAKS